MSHHDVLDTTDELREADELRETDESTAAFVDFLEEEFPLWTFAIERTETWSGDAHSLWIATQEGHHPQSALTAGKLHRRLSDYESRQSARTAESN